MARTPRKFQQAPSACYHLMNRGHNREAVFADTDDRRYFLNLILRYQKRFPALQLFHYCLMSNHFHLLARMDSAKALSALMAGLLRAYVPTRRWRGRPRKPPAGAEGFFRNSMGLWKMYKLSLRFAQPWAAGSNLIPSDSGQATRIFTARRATDLRVPLIPAG
jgi:REP element-mobilizing transposase RayT